LEHDLHAKGIPVDRWDDIMEAEEVE